MMVKQDFCIRLVPVVKKYPCLYNHYLPEYTRKDIAEKVWAEIGQELDEDGATCKEKWRNIKAVFARNLRSGRYNRKKKPYYLNELLEFLIPYLKPDASDDIYENTSSSFSTENRILKFDVNSNSDEPRANFVGIDDPLEIENTVEEWKINFNAHIDNNNSTNTKNTESASMDQSYNESCNCCSNKAKDEDPKKAFLISLLPDLNQMTDKEMRFFKRQTLALIDDIIDGRSGPSLPIVTRP